MSHLLSKALALIVFSGFLSTARAGILLEPYLGYNTLITDVVFGAAAGAVDGMSLKLGETGAGFGLRAGYSGALMFAALDYSTTKLSSTVKEKPEIADIDVSSSTMDSLGVTVGLDLPILRPYVGYIFDDKVKDGDSVVSGTG